MVGSFLRQGVVWLQRKIYYIGSMVMWELCLRYILRLGVVGVGGIYQYKELQGKFRMCLMFVFFGVQYLLFFCLKVNWEIFFERLLVWIRVIQLVRQMFIFFFKFVGIRFWYLLCIRQCVTYGVIKKKKKMQRLFLSSLQLMK